MLVQCQAYHGRAVFPHERKNAVEHCLLAVDGVHDRLAAVNAQATFQRFRVRAVKLQGGVRHALQAAHRFLHEGGLVQAGQPHIHIENLRAGGCLLDALAQDISHVTLPQRFLKPLLACGVDALADHAHTVHLYHTAGTAQRRAAPHLPLRHRLSAAPLCQQADVIGCCAAAAAHKRDAEREIFLHCAAEFFRGNVVLIGIEVRQAGVRLDEHGQVCPRAELSRKRQDLLRAEGAVDAHGVGAQPLERHGHGRHGDAGESAPVRFKAHRAENGEGGVLLCGKQGGLDFQQICHRFKHDQIGPGLCARHDNLAENIVGFVKA